MRIVLFLVALTILVIVVGLFSMVCSSFLLLWLFGEDPDNTGTYWGRILILILLFIVAEKYVFPLYSEAVRKWKDLD